MYGLIKKYEGLRLEAYPDPQWLAWDLLNKGKPKPSNWGEPWTIGYGTTFYEDGKKVSKGDVITKERAEQLLKWYCENKIKLPAGNFTDNQKEALYSLIYNIGQRDFDRSSCKKGIESKDWALASRNWDWVKAGGIVLKGLEKRREEERKLFFEGLKV